MWLNLSIILGTCVAVVVLTFFVYWIINKIKKILLASRLNSITRERQNPLTITEDIDDLSLEQPFNRAGYALDIQSKTDTKTEDNNWLNNGIPEVSTSTKKQEDDDWLNAGVEEVPTNVYKQQDDDWLIVEDKQPLETLDESSLNRETTHRPEIQITQNGSILDITITPSRKQDIKSAQTAINLKINLPPQDLARKGEEPYDIEITTDGSSTSYKNLQDILNVKTVEEPVRQSLPLIDEISTKPVENQAIERHAPMDEITVRPVESPVRVSSQLMDRISIKPVENQVLERHAPMDEITVRSIESPVCVSSQLAATFTDS